MLLSGPLETAYSPILDALDDIQLGILKARMLDRFSLNVTSETPLYRQLFEEIAHEIETGAVKTGERLPPTRVLAAKLRLNRTTVSAAYALLEEQGMIHGHVGRGSFVAGWGTRTKVDGLDWDSLLPKSFAAAPQTQPAAISFSTSRPADDLFPMAQFRQVAKEVIDSEHAREILQLGSPLGYSPLRRYLVEKASAEGVMRAGDDLIVTNGCQQGLDLLARVLFRQSEPVIVEDPVYHGLLRVFERAGATLVPAPVGEHGVEPGAVEALLAKYRPKAIVLTPSFQNPTGATIPASARARLVELAREYGSVLIENDIYSELRYRGEQENSLKRMDESGNTILLRSYSKVSFPGLRVGWVIAPRPVIARLAELKQTSDLHSDQLSQAVLLRFAESGELARHLERTRAMGALQLDAALRACRQYLPPGSKFTQPDGGINLWVQLPFSIDSAALLHKTQSRGVSYLPGGYFSAGRAHESSLRLSFGGLSLSAIEQGIRIIGDVAAEEMSASAQSSFEPATALV